MARLHVSCVPWTTQPTGFLQLDEMELGTGTTFTRTASYDSAVVRKLQTTSIRSWNVQVWSTVPKSLMKTLRKRGSWNKTSVSDKCKVAIGKVSVRGCQGLLKCSMMFQNPQSGSRVIWSTATTFMTRRGCGPWGGGCSMTFGYRFFLGTNHIPLPFQLFQEVSLWKLKVFFFTEKWISASVESPPSPSPPVGSKRCSRNLPQPKYCNAEKQ